MQITSQTHFRGNVHEFTFKHFSRKLGKREIVLKSIDPVSALRKAWTEIKKEYKKLK